MDMTSIITLIIAAFLLMYAVTLYNNLVALKHSVSKHFSNIDVLLKQRHDELPKLVETCRQYMQYEQQTLENVIEARSMVGEAETTLRAGLGNLFALAENYPDLKADKSFQHLQQRITALENGIADRRESYNEAVNNNNVRIEQFPDVIIARFLNFEAFDLLEFSEEELKDVDMKALFK